MATNKGRLDTRQRVRLANAISGRDMETIALGYLGFEDEELKSLIDEHKSQAQRINRDILQKWCNKNSGDTQTKVSTVVCKYLKLDNIYHASMYNSWIEGILLVTVWKGNSVRKTIQLYYSRPASANQVIWVQSSTESIFFEKNHRKLNI